MKAQNKLISLLLHYLDLPLNRKLLLESTGHNRVHMQMWLKTLLHRAEKQLMTSGKCLGCQWRSVAPHSQEITELLRAGRDLWGSSSPTPARAVSLQQVKENTHEESNESFSSNYFFPLPLIQQITQCNIKNIHYRRPQLFKAKSTFR